MREYVGFFSSLISFGPNRPSVHHAVPATATAIAIAIAIATRVSASQTAARLPDGGGPAASAVERANTPAPMGRSSGNFAVAARGGDAAITSWTPHLMQNRASARFACPQPAQENPAPSISCEPAPALGRDCPQPLQNLASSRLFVPQFEQVVIMALLVVSARHRYGGTLGIFDAELRLPGRVFLGNFDYL